MGAEIVFTLLEKLVLDYGRDPEVTTWLDRCEIYLVPVINVDGHDIVTSGRDPRWRKNARDVNGDGVTGVFPEGVDVNRGYDFNWAMGGTTVFIAAGVLLFASITGKLIGVHAAGKILKWKPGEASIIGWLLQTKALIMIIFVNILLDKQIITSETFTALLLMAVASTMLTVPVVSPRLERMKEIIFRSK